MPTQSPPSMPGCGVRASPYSKNSKHLFRRVSNPSIGTPDRERRRPIAMEKPKDSALRKHLLDLLNSGNAHATFQDSLRDFPAELRGKRPKGAPHSPWEVLEHLRIAKWDILEFSRNPKHESPKFPEGYWPKSPEPPDAKAWDRSVHS